MGESADLFGQQATNLAITLDSPHKQHTIGDGANRSAFQESEIIVGERDAPTWRAGFAKEGSLKKKYGDLDGCLVIIDSA